MSIRLKVARSPNEIDDVFWVRHEVYVKEDGKFGGHAFPHERISDRFDAMPTTENIIAYDGDEPIATLRATRDSPVGMPSDELFNFSSFRSSTGVDNAKFACGGMFAIRANWRGKRSVVHAMLKLITGIYHSWGVDYVIATSNHETVSVYEHLGFDALAEKVWVDHIGNFIVPMATPFSRMYSWAFGELFGSKVDRFWLEHFSTCFERVLLDSGEVLFKEGGEADHAYIIDDGWVSITRRDLDGEELTIATLGQGDVLGELALLDRKPRSATVIAATHVELIQIDRNRLFESVRNDGCKLERLLQLFAERIRRTDDLALVMAFAPQTGRVKYALESLRKVAIANVKSPDLFVVRIGPSELAKSSGVREHEVLRVLEMEKVAGSLDYGRKIIKFLR